MNSKIDMYDNNKNECDKMYDSVWVKIGFLAVMVVLNFSLYPTISFVIAILGAVGVLYCDYADTREGGCILWSARNSFKYSMIAECILLAETILCHAVWHTNSLNGIYFIESAYNVIWYLVFVVAVVFAIRTYTNDFRR